ncbi:hypothetical protein LH464_02515 [Neorhizobium sp. T786]|uniref:hypothetical protein n=1 Tax=Pseudorhizobium xiangyangii TaxID=2883104 RepID=UPI001CFFB464|nr:hypothetical protein [Neorhizobium xiangyangii]MCB5201351.1 hypothetical protein [Neorhizobium xiangyangii]
MRASTTALCAALSVALLAACNTSDALTPRVDVGAGLRPSTPVTQAEADQLAGTYRQSAYPSSSQAPAPSRSFPPQNTLEAQAQAIEAGNTSPAASDPIETSQPAPQPAPTSPPPAQSAAREPSAQATVRFLPIIGAPVQAVTPLSRQLGAQARASGLSIRASGDASTDHILKGYFSAFGDGDTITIVYVWDILDNAGTRLHRMQGQEQLPSSGRDPWSAVPPATMETIGTKTINEYMAWKTSRSG